MPHNSKDVLLEYSKGDVGFLTFSCLGKVIKVKEATAVSSTKEHRKQEFQQVMVARTFAEYCKARAYRKDEFKDRRDHCDIESENPHFVLGYN